MASVAFEGVWKRYDGAAAPAVRDLTLRIADGELVVLVGPSGCGKSTALRLVAGLEETSQGDIHIGDRRMNDVPPRDRDVAMVFQSYALYPHMTVRENLAFGLVLRGLPRAEIDRRVADAARTLGLVEYLDRKPAALSGGQRQRVAMGRAIVRHPAVFLFDEPLSNLDAKLRIQVRAEIARLHRSLGATMVYVTHDQVEAMTLADRMVVMNRGEVQQVGAPIEVYERPANRFVAGFIGSPPMNFLDGRLLRDGRGAAVEVAGARFKAAGAAARHEGQVVVGVRPEDLCPDPAPGRAALRATVELVELVGAEAYLCASLGGASVTARVPPRTAARPGEAIDLYLEPAKAHLFEPGEAGRAIG